LMSEDGNRSKLRTAKILVQLARRSIRDLKKTPSPGRFLVYESFFDFALAQT
jgi:hypothetical protein